MNKILLLLLLAGCDEPERAPKVIETTAMYDYRCKTDRDCWMGHVCLNKQCVLEDGVK